ncbi:SYCP3 [Mytilus edulis]|uniref:SYCP3 n=1 Tax=Mytilus edulis TaxID=6550 RepID=A0A8S3Q4Z6_MYTED|nr:SYCP3 [Mytilus edulis]
MLGCHLRKKGCIQNRLICSDGDLSMNKKHVPSKYMLTRKMGSDVKVLEELMFGSVGMAYKGPSFKVHFLRNPSQMMLTKVFIPENHQTRESIYSDLDSIDSLSIHSNQDLSISDPKQISQHNRHGSNIDAVSTQVYSNIQSSAGPKDNLITEVKKLGLTAQAPQVDSEIHKFEPYWVEVGPKNRHYNTRRQSAGNALEIFRDDVIDLYTTPRLSEPVWLNMMSHANTEFKNKEIRTTTSLKRDQNRGLTITTLTNQCTLQEPEKVEKIQLYLINCLRNVAKKSYKNPDERLWKILDKFTLLPDITKTMVAKRKRLEQLTQNSLKNTNKKVEDIWTTQKNERVKLQDEYNRQISNVLGQWESDIEKTKEQEEKLTLLFKQQQKLFQQARVVQSQRLKTVQQLHEQYSKVSYSYRAWKEAPSIINRTVEINSSLFPEKSPQPVVASQLVCNLIEAVLQLWKLKMSPEFCLMHLEDRLQEIYFKSKMLAEYLKDITTDGSKKCSVHDLTHVLGFERGDLPLLMAIAGTHSLLPVCL